MVTTGAGKSDKVKARNKSIALAKKEHDNIMKGIFSLTGLDKLNYDIQILKRDIRLCDDDLAGMFKGNIAILNKKSILLELLKEKEAELANYGK